MEKHNCESNILYDGEYQFDSDSVFFYGYCFICNKKFVEIFKKQQIEELKDI